jgi:hypothetical protein
MELDTPSVALSRSTRAADPRSSKRLLFSWSKFMVRSILEEALSVCHGALPGRQFPCRSSRVSRGPVFMVGE